MIIIIYLQYNFQQHFHQRLSLKTNFQNNLQSHSLNKIKDLKIHYTLLIGLKHDILYQNNSF